MSRTRLVLAGFLSVLCLLGGWLGIASYVKSTVHHDDIRLEQIHRDAQRSQQQLGERTRVLACRLVMAEVNTTDPTTAAGKDKRANFLRIARDPLLHCL